MQIVDIIPVGETLVTYRDIAVKQYNAVKKLHTKIGEAKYMAGT